MATWYASIYLTDLAYGGSEEGGWYYPCGEFRYDLPYGKFPTKAKARKYHKELERLCSELNEGAPDISSVLSRGRYVAVLEKEPPANYPKVRPHYE